MVATNNNKKSLTKNSVYYLIYNVLNVVFPFITGIYVARTLLQSDIGQVESARNIAQYFVIFAFLGIPTYGLREIAKYRNDKIELNKVYSELIIINSLSTAFFLAIYLVLVIFTPYYRSHLNVYLISGISIALNFLNNSWLYEGLEEFKYISLRNILFKALSFVLLIVLVRGQSDYLWYLAITVIGTAGNYLLNILNSHKHVRFSFKNINLRRHLKSIIFLVFVNLAIEIYSLIDVTMLGFLSGNVSVALYSYAMKIHRIFLYIVNTFTLVLVPRISLLFKEGNMDEFNRLVTKSFKVIIIISIPLIVGIFFVSNYLFVAIYGPEYLQSAQIMKILSLVLTISPIGYLLGSRILLVAGKENLMIYPVCAGAIANILLNLLLIPAYNEIGAAIASVIGEIVVMVVYLSLSNKYFKLNNCYSTMVRILLSVSVMCSFLFMISLSPLSTLFKTIFQITGSIAIYFGILFITKENVVREVAFTFFRKLKK